MLIALEGIDGAGKRTLGESLVVLSECKGYEAMLLSFPCYGRTKSSQEIANILRNHDIREEAPEVLALLFSMDRAESLPQLQEALEKKDIVFVDRYIFSNFAYHLPRLSSLLRRERFVQTYLSLEKEHFGLPMPDGVVFLEQLPVIAARFRLKRVAEGGQREDSYEKDEGFLEKVNDAYGELLEDKALSRQVGCWWYRLLGWREEEEGFCSRSLEDLTQEVWQKGLVPKLNK